MRDDEDAVPVSGAPPRSVAWPPGPIAEAVNSGTARIQELHNPKL